MTRWQGDDKQKVSKHVCGIHCTENIIVLLFSSYIISISRKLKIEFNSKDEEKILYLYVSQYVTNQKKATAQTIEKQRHNVSQINEVSNMATI